jgi:hypothetical protein
MTNKSGRDSVVGARRGGSLMAKDRRCVGMAIRVWVSDTHRVLDLTGIGMGMIFYP